MQMVKSAVTSATNAFRRLLFAVKCPSEFIGTIAATNLLSGVASADWNQSDWLCKDSHNQSYAK